MPDHSTFSQNRRRRFSGTETFRKIFETVVYKCAEAGLVRTENIVMDSTHIKANAAGDNMEWVEVIEGPSEYWQKLAAMYPEMFAPSDFVFDKENDRYICPNGCFLTFRGMTKKSGQPLRRYCTVSKDCKNCPLKPKCISSKVNYRSIARQIHQEDRESGRLRIGTPKFNEIMRKRKIVCEGFFVNRPMLP